MEYKIDEGTVSHIPSKTTLNKFIIIGQLWTKASAYEDYLSLNRKDVLQFRLLDESRVESVVAMLPRVETAEAEWAAEAKVGVLHLHLQPPQNASEAAADAAEGGRARTIRLKDLLRELSRDQEITRSRDALDRSLGMPSREPVMPRPRRVPQPEPKVRPPEVEEPEMPM